LCKYPSKAFCIILLQENKDGTVDGRTPAPPGIYKTLQINANNGITHILMGAGFLPSTVLPDLVLFNCFSVTAFSLHL